ncbi:hypothetical protein SH2C18_37370 [Clostridium sediminicola]|uniref:hypothetical protein n=1 Tax=Clostridium sediminicola TaxID=3114879 RepID=UPI0031F20C23
MSKSKDNLQSRIDKMNEKIENANRIDEIINTTEAYARTERHLEQHSDISKPESIEHAKEVQKDRKKNIEELKNRVVYGGNLENNDYDNLLKNYASTEGYIENNLETMDMQDLNILKEKQEKREEKMNELT